MRRPDPGELTNWTPRDYPRAMNWLPLAFLFSCAAAAGPEADFFLSHALNDPELRIEDAYKWLHQATRGGEHAIGDETAVRLWLNQEWAGLAAPLPAEPLWTPLDSEGRIGRLNLRPFRAGGGTPGALHDAFVAGARDFDASPARFRRAWRTLGKRLAAAPTGHLTGAAWRRLDADMRAKGYPAVHHSPEYVESRQPAYRVLPAREARRLLGSKAFPESTAAD